MHEHVTYNGLTFVPFIRKERIAERVEALAREISEEYRDKTPLLVCVLNGAFPFASDLIRAIDPEVYPEITFIRLKSYSGMHSTGHVREIVGLQTPVEGRHVIIVEDIVDSGRTIKGLVDQLRAQNPASVRVASLLFKPESLQVGTPPDYIGFPIGPEFIIGYGLDIDEQARNLPDIYVLEEK